MWEKLSNVQEEVLANYLKNEYPQTVAVVMSKLRPEHAARVLGILPEELSLDVVNRMLKMEAVQKEVLERVEQTLRTEFMSSLSQTRRRDAHEVMAEFSAISTGRPNAFHHALEEDTATRRAHQGADVHLRRPVKSRRRLGANLLRISIRTSGDRAGSASELCASSSSTLSRAARCWRGCRKVRCACATSTRRNAAG
jgi:hypothetical protein